MSYSIRDCYNEHGLDFYKNIPYNNPHFVDIKFLVESNLNHIRGTVLDMCCGNGEITSILKNNCIGVDPYLYEKYKSNTGNYCLPYSFKDMIEKGLPKVDTIICSYAIHLCCKSMLPMLLYSLSQSSDNLIIISPSDSLEIKHYWKLKNHVKHNRTHWRQYEH